MQQQPRFIRNYVFYVSLALMVTCLAATFYLTGEWTGLVSAAGLGVLWFFSRGRNNRWLPHMLLFLSLAVSAASILSGGNPLFGMAGSVFALMVWDTHQLICDLQEIPQKETISRFEWRHLRSLVLAMGTGLSIAIIGRMISLKAPFILLFALVLLILFGLDRLWSQLARYK